MGQSSSAEHHNSPAVPVEMRLTYEQWGRTYPVPRPCRHRVREMQPPCPALPGGGPGGGSLKSARSSTLWNALDTVLERQRRDRQPTATHDRFDARYACGHLHTHSLRAERDTAAIDG